jgi:molecular chaperone DnaK
MASRILGIDLGTTNSCVAVIDDRGTVDRPGVARGRAHDAVGRGLAGAGGDVLVGTPARRQAVSNAAQTVFGTKRLVGRKVNNDDVALAARTAPYRIVAAPNGDAWVRIGTVAARRRRSPRTCCAGCAPSPSTRWASR